MSAPERPARAAIAVRDVEMRFGASRVLKDVNLDVPAGSLSGLIGSNGAGKTTTMRILVTDLRATSGTVEVLGHRLPDEAPRLRGRLGYMPDDAGLYEELTLHEYLSFFASLYGLRGGERKAAVETAMELGRVAAFRGRRLTGLSKGERQRILLARTLIHDPEILVLDEPADGLDPRGRVELRELLSLLHERGKTILISSHILADLQEICTHFALIDHGRVVFSGSREELRARGFSGSRIRIEAIGDPASLLRKLGAIAGVSVEGSDGTIIEVSVAADAASAWEVLRSIVGDGIPIASFARSQDSLEAIYLRLTSGPAP
ncbi:MAG: ABC transporter ATP-binding protein [Acidobacteriota bacterium]